MKAFLSTALALGLSILFVLTNAGLHFDVSQRRGFTKQLLERANGLKARQGVNTTDYRFYNNKTAREPALWWMCSFS